MPEVLSTQHLHLDFLFALPPEVPAVNNQFVSQLRRSNIKHIIKHRILKPKINFYF